MAEQISILRQRFDEASVRLASLESERDDHMAEQSPRPRRGSAAKLSKLQKYISGARLALGNAKKRLDEALALQQQNPPDNSDAVGPQQMDLDGGGTTIPPNLSGTATASSAAWLAPPPDVSTSSSMSHVTMETSEPPPPCDVMDTAGATDENTVHPAILNESLLPSEPVAADGNTAPPALLDNASLAAAPIIPVIQDSQPPPSRDVAPISDTSLPTAPTISAVQASQPPPSPDISELGPVSLKRINRSESEDEKFSGKDTDMNLFTSEDKAELQQQLFKRRFSANAPPNKKTKYVEISSGSDATGDSDIFNDDEETGPAKLGDSNTPIVAQTANIHLQSKASVAAAGSKAQDLDDDTASGKQTGAITSKGVDIKIDRKGKARADVSEMTKDAKNKGTKSKVKDREDYRPSEHLVAKAARAEVILGKQRERWAEKEGAGICGGLAECQVRGRASRVPPGIELIRKDPDYLPDVATADYDLTRELLRNHSKNYLCIPHVKLNRKIVTETDNLEGPVKILGVPLPRNQNPNVSTNIPRPPNHFHCGCDERVAVAGFVMWKTWKAKSRIDGEVIEEGLHKHWTLHPREILFFLQFLKTMFGYTVEDMFMGSLNPEERAKKHAWTMKKVADHCMGSQVSEIGERMSPNDNISEQEEEEDNWF